MRRRHALTLAFCLLAGSISANPATAATIAAAAISVPPPVVEPTQTVTGVVTDTATSNPIPGACVSAHFGDGSFISRACAGDDGRYTFSGFPRVSAKFGASAPGFPTMWFPRAADMAPSVVQPSLSGDAKTLNFALTTATSTVSGLIRLPNLDPAPYATVNLFRTGDPSASVRVITGPDGTFSRDNVFPGSYQLSVVWTPYGVQWHPRVGDRTAATTLNLIAGGTVNIEETFREPAGPVTLPVLKTLTGRVSTPSGQPVAGATVTVQAALAHYATTTSDADGRYTVRSLPGCCYAIGASAPGKHSVWAPDSPRPVTRALPAGANPVVDLVMPDAVGTLRGTVTDFDGSAAPFPTYIGFYRDEATLVADLRPGLASTFEIPNMPPGQYRMRISHSGRSITQWYPASNDWANAETITVTAGGVTEVNPTLVGPSFVDVYVSDRITGAPVAGTCVSIYSFRPCTGPDGHAFGGPLWNSIPVQHSINAQNPLFHHGTSVQVEVPPRTVLPVDMKVDLGAAVELPVTLAGGNQPNEQVCVHAYPSGLVTNDFFQACGHLVDGKLTVGPLPHGQVNLLIGPGTSFGAQWLGTNGGTGKRGNAALVTLERGKVRTAPAARLDPPGAITGIIRNHAGTPQSGACATLADRPFHGACTSVEGMYTVSGLGPYAWELQYRGYWGQAPEWSGDASSRMFATTIPVREGRTTIAPEVVLGIHGVLAGMVIPDQHLGENARLDAFDARTGDWITGQYVARNAALEQLNTGPVLVRFSRTGFSCWLYRPGYRQLTPYFSVSAGWGRLLPDTLQPGENCLPDTPTLVGNGEPRQRPGEPSPTPLTPRRPMHFGAWVQAELSRLLPPS